MRKTLSSLLVFTLSTIHLFAQTQIVRGTILDVDAQIPLIGATIQLVANPQIGSTTDVDGQFVLDNVPVGRQNFLVQYLGYEQKILEEVLITPSREVLLDIVLKESIAELDEIVVKASANNHAPLNEMSMISARSMTIEELNRQPATFFDPARMALGFAGVAQSGDDITNEIVVRGNSPRGVLWRIEGIEMPNPNHFAEQGSAGGGISMLSTNAMGTSDFFAGAFPAEYGNALSGVFDIKMRNGNNAQTETAVQVGLLGLDAAIEGPLKIGNRGSYLLNYRYSTLSILGKLGILPAGDGIPNFQDLSMKVYIPTTNFGTFSLFGIGGSYWEEDDYTSIDIERRDRFYGNTGILGLSHLLNLSDKTYLKTVFATSYAENNYEEGPLNSEQSKIETIDYEELFKDKANRLSILVNHKFNNKNTIRVGGVFSLLGYDVALNERDYEVTLQDGMFVQNFLNTWSTLLKGDGNSSSMQAYFQWKYHIAANLTMNTGVHYLRFALNKGQSLEPRFGLNWQFTPRQTLALGVGRHSKIESLGTYFVQRLNTADQPIYPNRNLPLQKAMHYILSYDIALAKKLNLKVEGYYQNINNMAISNVAGSTEAFVNQYYFDIFFGENSLIGEGKGRNYGVDISLEKGLSNDYYYLVNASLYKTEYQTTTGDWYDTKFSSKYNLVAMGGKEFHFGENQRHTIGLNAKLIMNGGLRYTPIDRTASLAQQQTVLESIPFTKNLPAYFRTDFGIYYRWYKKKIVQSLSLNIQNLTNRSNIFNINEFYNPIDGIIQTRISYQTEILPILSYRIEF